MTEIILAMADPASDCGVDTCTTSIASYIGCTHYFKLRPNNSVVNPGPVASKLLDHYIHIHK